MISDLRYFDTLMSLPIFGNKLELDSSTMEQLTHLALATQIAALTTFSSELKIQSQLNETATTTAATMSSSQLKRSQSQNQSQTVEEGTLNGAGNNSAQLLSISDLIQLMKLSVSLSYTATYINMPI